MPFRFLPAASLVTALCLASALYAQDKVSLDPAHTEVHFTLGSTLHEVHGTFNLQQGDISFDPATGKASGAIVVDALSGQSGNASRDRRMSTEELKSASFKTISFTPTLLTGAFNPAGDSTLSVHGTFTLLGTPHEIDVPMKIHVAGDQFHADGSFVIPYVKWGLKDPSTFILRVSKQVQINLSLAGTLRQQPTN